MDRTGVSGGAAGDTGGAANFVRKLGSGLAAGAMASVLITPIDLVMINQFVESGRVDPKTGALLPLPRSLCCGCGSHGGRNQKLQLLSDPS